MLLADRTEKNELLDWLVCCAVSAEVWREVGGKVLEIE